jgi:hypothetical protein
MTPFTIHCRVSTQYGRPETIVTLIVQGGRGLRDRIAAAIEYGLRVWERADDVEVEGDGPESHRSMLRAIGKLEDSGAIKVTREYSLIQERHIYRASLTRPVMQDVKDGPRASVTVVIAAP